MKRSSRPTRRKKANKGGRSGAGRRIIAASEFKAKCLRILEEVAAGQQVLVTKHGDEIALVSPVRPRETSTSRGRWKGMVGIKGDIVHSDWSEEFDALR